MNVRRILSRTLIILLVIAISLGAGGFYYFRTYLPGTVAPQSFPMWANLEYYAMLWDQVAI